ncbi:hypothetical protein JXA56_05800 [Candidatus Micrarchaeota archaeon]|nr:hypothetical protein [Candidatus Micrarchaeota archaeon]
MLRILVFLLLVPFAWANEIVAAKIYEQQDFGPLSFNEFLYSISVDCTAGTVNVIVMNENFSRVSEAANYLRYVDFSQPLISTVKTDKDGLAVHKLPGNVKLMRGFFILVIQKNGFKNKEIHFDISGCYKDGPVIQPKPPGYREPVNKTIIVGKPVADEPAEETVEQIEEPVEKQDPADQPVCLPALILPLLLFFKMAVHQ